MNKDVIDKVGRRINSNSMNRDFSQKMKYEYKWHVIKRFHEEIKAK